MTRDIWKVVNIQVTCVYAKRSLKDSHTCSTVITMYCIVYIVRELPSHACHRQHAGGGT